MPSLVHLIIIIIIISIDKFNMIIIINWDDCGEYHLRVVWYSWYSLFGTADTYSSVQLVQMAWYRGRR